VKPETRQDIATRLVVEAEGLVARQQELVAYLDHRGCRTAEALALLDQFENTLANFRRILARLQFPQP